MIAILQKYSKIAEGPLSAKKFIDLGGTPTIATFFTRFGSWMKACEAAGVESGKVARDNYTRAHSEETMLAYIEAILQIREPTAQHLVMTYGNAALKAHQVWDLFANVWVAGTTSKLAS